MFQADAVTHADRREVAGLAASAAAAIFWGTNFEATRLVLIDIPPWSAAALRFVLAALAIVVWLAATRGINWRVLRDNAPALVILGLVGVAGFNIALFLGMQTSSPVTAALIMGTTPLTTTLLDAVLRRHRPAAVAILGMGLSLAGVALTAGAFSGARLAPGDFLIAAGSVAASLYTIGCRRWVVGATPLENSTWTMVFGAAAMAILAIWIEDPVRSLAHASALSWAASVYMALIGSVLAFVFWQTGIATRGPAATSVMFNLIPVSALAVAAALGRMPDLWQIAGVVLAVFGVLLASGRIGARPRPSA